MNLNKFKNFFLNQYFIITIITIVGLFIRLLNIDKPYGLWHDEMLVYIFSSESFPVGIIKTLLHYDFHMPLYYMYAHFWMKFFGNTDIVLRYSSIIWGVLTIPALFYLGRLYKSEKVGYFLAIIGCLSPILIYYSQEFRFYSMLVFFSTLSLIAFLKLIDTQDKKSLFLFGISNLIILYIYTTGFVFVGIEMLILFVHFYLYKKNALINFLRYSLLFCILAMPYFILLFTYVDASNQSLFNPFGWQKQPFYVVGLVINDLLSPFLTCIYGQINFVNRVNSLFIALCSISTIFLLIGFISCFEKSTKKLIYLTIILITFFGFEILSYMTNNLVLSPKYFLVGIPIFLLFCVDGLLSIRIKWLKQICILFIFTAYILNVANYKKTMTFDLRANGFKYAENIFKQLNLNKNDYVLFPNGSINIRKYYENTNYIAFDYNKITNIDKTKQECLKIFDKDFCSTTNKRNIHEKLIPYFMASKPTPQLIEFMNSYINKIPVGSKLIFIDDRFSIINPNEVRDYFKIYSTQKDLPSNYKSLIYIMFFSRFYEDLYNIFNSNPSLIKVKEMTYYSANVGKIWRFIIYQKV